MFEKANRQSSKAAGLITVTEGVLLTIDVDSDPESG